ncbi:MAG: bifunctional DNA-formamidopyrimidine glycosylase/DNA-(apurinic or apyrimidinic site) lyase [Candidatus Daviesbacteria bacterium]|nr:bifunctional DNA-formamidopyrimidine glycosylase/DNA-(apurinic or apyrimidinic site) lyase [Candidatus Daviesbacteria bacterium]
MPELPEVETIKLGLQKKITGKTLKNIQILNSKTFFGDEKKVEGAKVKNVWRKAKMLGVDLESNLTLLFHLKMTGQLIYVDKSETDRIIGGHPTPDMKGALPNKSTRVIFEFSNGSKLYFNDQRKFGWVKLLSTDKVGELLAIKSLGPEPLEKDFNWEILKSKLLHHKSQPIKIALMDQTVVSGIGNIYASEALFDAKIDPRRKVSTLSDDEFKKLVKGIQKSLTVSIEKGGSTRAHFVDVEGKKGYFLDYANVYGKEGKKCNGCPGKVEKIQQAGRGTYFCPSCQR